jgi:hypothetical protein
MPLRLFQSYHVIIKLEIIRDRIFIDLISPGYKVGDVVFYTEYRELPGGYGPRVFTG